MAVSKSPRASATGLTPDAASLFSQLIDQRFEHIEAGLARIEEVLKAGKSDTDLSVKALSESLKIVKAEADARAGKIEERCTKLEASNNILRWLAGTIGAVVIAMVIGQIGSQLMRPQYYLPPNAIVAPAPAPAPAQTYERSYTWYPY